MTIYESEIPKLVDSAYKELERCKDTSYYSCIKLFIPYFLHAYEFIPKDDSQFMSFICDGSKDDDVVSQGVLVKKPWASVYLKRVETKSCFESALTEIFSLDDAQNGDIDYIFITDFDELLACDLKQESKLNTHLSKLSDHYKFFLRLMPPKRSTALREFASAPERSVNTKLLCDYVNVLKTDDRHNLSNIFLVRLCFCFYAEQCGIFKPNQFTEALKQQGEDNLKIFFIRLFRALKTPVAKRGNSTPSYINDFPYIDGDVFKDTIIIPKLPSLLRKFLIENAGAEWGDIDLPAFELMVNDIKDMSKFYRNESYVQNLTRLNMQAPLDILSFMPLIKELVDIEDLPDKRNLIKKRARLAALMNKIGDVKVVDPFCQSGILLCCAYNELHDLQMKVMYEYRRLAKKPLLLNNNVLASNFCGIDSNSFAVKMTRMSLLMCSLHRSLEARRYFGPSYLHHDFMFWPDIVCGDPLKLDWNDCFNTHHRTKTSDFYEKTGSGKPYQLYVMGVPQAGLPGGKIGFDEDSHADDQDKSSLTYLSEIYDKATDFVTDQGGVSFLVPQSMLISTAPTEFWSNIISNDFEISATAAPLDLSEHNEYRFTDDKVWICIEKNTRTQDRLAYRYYFRPVSFVDDELGHRQVCHAHLMRFKMLDQIPFDDQNFKPKLNKSSSS